MSRSPNVQGYEQMEWDDLEVLVGESRYRSWTRNEPNNLHDEEVGSILASRSLIRSHWYWTLRQGDSCRCFVAAQYRRTSQVTSSGYVRQGLQALHNYNLVIRASGLLKSLRARTTVVNMSTPLVRPPKMRISISKCSSIVNMK